MDEVEKRSLLDFIQANQLRKTAKKYADKGDVDDAVAAWVQSVQQNPGDDQSVREFVSYLLDNDPGSRFVGQAVNFGQWLLQLSKTNQVDSVLVSKVYNKYGFPSESLQLMEPIKDQFDDSAKVDYVKTLFENQKLTEFLEEYNNLPQNLQNLPDVKRLYLAYTFGFSENEQAAEEARMELLSMLEKDSTNDLLHRLIYLVAIVKNDTNLMDEILTGLISINAARPQHHHALWMVLSANGQLEDAKNKARSYPYPPYTALGLVSQYNTLIKLGLSEEADLYAEKHINKFGYVPQPWLAVFESLTERAEWELLGKFSDQMLLDPRVAIYSAFGHYYQGKSHLGLYKFAAATDSFNQITARSLAGHESAMAILQDLTFMGYSTVVKVILKDLQTLEGWADKTEFWRVNFQVGWNMRDLQTCLEASFKLYQMNPTNLQDNFNYASCLIAERKRPQEALLRSKDILDRNPQFIPALINYSLALLLDNQLDEADRILTISINESSLSDTLKPGYYLAKFELYLKREDIQRAYQTYPLIKRDELFQEQQKWLLQAYAAIENLVN